MCQPNVYLSFKMDTNEALEVVDFFCGVGGFSSGAMLAGAKPIMGADNNDKMVRLWGANTNGKCVLAELWTESVKSRWPVSKANMHVHLSPPCPLLSSARRGLPHNPAGINMLQETLQFAIDQKYTSWSLETVSTPEVRELVDRMSADSQGAIASVTVDAADYNTPSNRLRLIVGNTRMIHNLREIPVSRISVSEAFQQAGMEIPASYIKNNTTNKHGNACPRSIEGTAHTQTASHPLMWCTRDGQTIRCLTVPETAVIMGFPKSWLLPNGSRDGIRAVGNAVPPPLARAIINSAQLAIQEGINS